MSPHEKAVAIDRLLVVCFAVAVAAGAFIWAVAIWPALQRNRARFARDSFEQLANHLDYQRRLLEHQPCDGYPCKHDPYGPGLRRTVGDHCRCGNEWVCQLAGPLNETEYTPDVRNRQPRDGRWAA